MTLRNFTQQTCQKMLAGGYTGRQDNELRKHTFSFKYQQFLQRFLKIKHFKTKIKHLTKNELLSIISISASLFSIGTQ